MEEIKPTMENQDELVLVYRLNLPPIEILRSQIIFTDRSRIEEGACPRKRYLKYEADGIGYSPIIRNEDLLIGGATHEGLDLLIQGGSLEKALEVTEEYYNSAPPMNDYLLPEQQSIIAKDGIHLSKAFVYAFNSVYLPQLLDEYEIVEVEEEINWLVDTITYDDNLSHNKYIVMMSRTDGVVRHKLTDKLWNLSHKTSQNFDDIVISKLDIDPQRFSESLAVEAKYGKPVEGTLYNYFLKSGKWKDDELNISRFTSGLIRPYVNRLAQVGDLTPDLLSYSYEWNELDGHISRKRRLGKGWERCNIYDEMNYLTYLQWLEQKLIPHYKDYLQEIVVGLVPVFYNPLIAQRWLTGIKATERQWSQSVDFVGSNYISDDHNLNSEFPLISSQCFSYNKKCGFHPCCWGNSTISSLIQSGNLITRSPNHQQETGEYNL